MHIHKFFYVKIFKIAPTCFDPKIIFRELHCSLLKSYLKKKKHSLINFNLVLWQHTTFCHNTKLKSISECIFKNVTLARNSGAP